MITFLQVIAQIALIIIGLICLFIRPLEIWIEEYVGMKTPGEYLFVQSLGFILILSAMSI